MKKKVVIPVVIVLVLFLFEKKAGYWLTKIPEAKSKTVR